MRRFVGSILFGVLVATTTLGQSSVAKTPAVIAIEPQPLGQALDAWARQTGLQVIYGTDLVQGRQCGSVVAGATPRDALAHLLAGTGLAATWLNERTVSINAAQPAAELEDDRSYRSRSAMQVARVDGALKSAEDQERAGQEKSAQDDESSRQSIQEIIVTAQKREERLQDVPSSISVLSALDIERKGIVSLDDFMRGVPGAYRMELGASRKNPIVIRGLSVQPDSADAGVALYFGEVPLQSSLASYGDHFGTADPSLVDMQRIEVLKGPQGTLYGSNSLAGIVREQPAEPDLREFGGKVAAGYSNTGKNGDDNYLGNGVLNLPLVEDKFAVRLVGYWSSDSGYVKNVAASGGAARPSFLVQSGQLGASLVDEDHVGRVDRTGARATALWRPVDAFKASYMFVHQEAKQDGFPEVMLPLGTYEQAYTQVPRRPRKAGQDTTTTINNLVLDYDFSRAQLMSSTSHIDTDFEFLRDISFAGLGPLDQLSQVVLKEFSQEVRLTSKLEGPFQYLLGGFYEDSSLHANYASAGGVAWWEGDPAQAANFYATNFGPFIPGAPVQPQFNQLFPTVIDQGDGVRADVQQKSFFGEMSYELREGLKATVGARRFNYTTDVKNSPYNIPALGTINDPNNIEKLSSSQSGNVFKAALSYKPNEDGLLYGQWSQGFKLGGPLGRPGPSCDPDGDGIVTIVTADGRQVTQSRQFIESDRTDNFEVGGKFSLLNRRASIQASVYSINWDKIPVTVYSPTATCAASLNAGKARSQGVEVETDFLLGAGLSAHLGASYVKAELTEDDTGGIGSKGDRLPGSPRFNGNAALNYDFSLGGRNAYARGDVTYVGSFYNNLQQLGTPAGGYYQLNLRSGVTYGPANLDFYINNVTNEDGFTWVYTVIATDGRAFRLRPRTVGMQLTWNF